MVQRGISVVSGITLWELGHFYRRIEGFLDVARALGVRSSYPKVSHFQKVIWRKVNEKSKDLCSLKGVRQIVAT